MTDVERVGTVIIWSDPIREQLMHVDHPSELHNHCSFYSRRPSEDARASKSHVACQAVFIERPPGSRVLILEKKPHNIIFI